MDLKEIKSKIKQWEIEFLTKTGTKPNKDDIHCSSEEIKELYRSYWKLKKLEQNSETQKDRIWGLEFNKPHQVNSTTKLQKSSIIQKLSDKLRDGDRHIQTKKFSNTIKKEPKVPKDEVLYVSEKAELKIKKSEVSKNTFENETTLDLTLPNKLKSIKIHKHPNSYKSVKKVNLLSTTVVVSQIEHKSHFQRDINPEWLDRCTNNLETFHEREFVTENVFADSNGKEESIEIQETLEKPRVLPVNEDDRKHTEFNKTPENSFVNVMKHSDNIVCSSKEHDNCTEQSFNNVSKLATQNKRKRCESTDSESSENLQIENGSFSEKLSFGHENALISQSSVSDNGQTHTRVKRAKSNEFEDVPIGDLKRASHLKRKIAAGKLNENYVKLDIRKKIFVRGYRKTNVRKMKWKKWKDLKKNQGSGGGDVTTASSSKCFKCGEIGHWAHNCKSDKGSTLLPSCEEDYDDVLPTLEDAAKMCQNVKTIESKKRIEKKHYKSIETSENNSSDFLMSDPSLNFEKDETTQSVLPLFHTENGNLIDTPNKVFNALKEMGYKEFRNGQETAIMRILSGLSTLIVLPTGSGKTLCYQLPAYLYAQEYRCITLVISPLVSLMDDQVTGLAKCIRAVCYHSGMTEVQKKLSLDSIIDGSAQILLVSPEAIIGSRGRDILPVKLPPIAFVCIDEAHCLSEWSHNFRPSYLQLYKVLTKQLGVKCILGLTATATCQTARDIAQYLNLNQSEGSVVGNTDVPPNLHISISRDKDKDSALLKLLKGERFNSCMSIIIYCIRRDETERIATLIRTLLQDECPITSDEHLNSKTKEKSKKKGKTLLWSAEAYHAGLTASRRRTIQKSFMNDKLRIVVATNAFGMGLDKSDVRVVLHYNMPKTFESYVQEIGRAGRDHLDAHCHMFIENEGKDLCELKRHIYSTGIDRHSIKKLFKKIFQPCKCLQLQNLDSSSNNTVDCHKDIIKECPKHEIAFPIQSTVQDLDMKEENILTLLCYLELHPNHYIELMSPAYTVCTIRCYGGPKQLMDTAKKCGPVAVSMALDKKVGKNVEKSAEYQFQVIEVASCMGWDSGSLKRELKNLEWNGNKKSGVIVEFSELAFRLKAPGNINDDEFDEILISMHKKVTDIEQTALWKLNSLHKTFQRHSYPHYWSCCDEVDYDRSYSMKNVIKEYFERENTNGETERCEVQSESIEFSDDGLSEVRHYVRDIIHTNHDQTFTGRAIARIFHGIGSPCYPAEVWGRVTRFWRCLLPIDFYVILKIANEELRKLK